MTNEKLENNEQVTRKPVKSFKEKRQFNRFRDRKNKKLYECNLDYDESSEVSNQD